MLRASLIYTSSSAWVVRTNCAIRCSDYLRSTHPGASTCIINFHSATHVHQQVTIPGISLALHHNVSSMRHADTSLGAFPSISSTVANRLITSQRRFVYQSKEFVEATKDLAKTPGGKNPYDVLGATISKATTWDDLQKIFREKTRECHPDHGGSNEKMAELNSAKMIIKENHSEVIKKMNIAETAMKSQEVYQQSGRNKHASAMSSGGIHMENSQKSPSGKARNAKEIEKEWDVYKSQTEDIVMKMCSRYEVAIEHGRFFRKSSLMSEITVRERWLRKTFIKGVWENVHEMRSELLRCGTRNSQQAQIAEEMVSFAGTVEGRLTENFKNLTQKTFTYQAKLMTQWSVNFTLIIVFSVYFLIVVKNTIMNNTLTGRYHKDL